MTQHPPQAVAMGDQMHAEMVDTAMRMIAVHDLTLNGDAQLYMEIGVGAGITAAMQILIARGLLATA